MNNPWARKRRVAWRGALAAAVAAALVAGTRPVRGDNRAPAAGTTNVYRNPVLADVAGPFVLTWRGEYYLYRASVGGDGALDVLISRDLVHWKPGPVVWRPGAMPDDATRGTARAPEVYAENGRFFLLFSAASAAEPGSGERLWAAVADSPLGPFRLLSDRPLTPPGRADGHVFVQDGNGGEQYLFSTFFPRADGARIQGRELRTQFGSRTLADRLRALAEGRASEADTGAWRTLIAPQSDGPENGRVEAPTLFKRGDTYYLLYAAAAAAGGASSGRIGYATARAAASAPLGPWTRRGALVPGTADAPRPGSPGVVLGPDNATLFLLYDRARPGGGLLPRDLMLKRLDVSPGGALLTVKNAPGAMPAPPAPAFADYFDGPAALGPAWLPLLGLWSVDASAREVRQTDSSAPFLPDPNAPPDRWPAPTFGRLRLTHVTVSADGVVSVSVRRIAGWGEVGIALTTTDFFRLIVLVGSDSVFSPDGTKRGKLSVLTAEDARIARRLDTGSRATGRGLGVSWDVGVYHHLRVVRRGGRALVYLDGEYWPSVEVPFPSKAAATLELVTVNSAGAFSGLSVTSREPAAVARPTGRPAR